MTSSDFNRIVKDVTNKIKDTLCVKAAEYALSGDRLSALKQGGKMWDTDAGNALLGMLNKHIVSLYQMVQSKNIFPLERWWEKGIDAINYTILLLAIKTEEFNNAQN